MATARKSCFVSSCLLIKFLFSKFKQEIIAFLPWALLRQVAHPASSETGLNISNNSVYQRCFVPDQK